MRVWIAIVCLAAVVRGQGSADELVFKQVSAPATDIVSGRVRLPDPADLATTSQALFVPIEFGRASDGTWTFERTLHIGADGALAFALLTPETAQFAVEVSTAGGPFTSVEHAFGWRSVEVRSQSPASERPGWRVDRYDVANVTAGERVLRLRSSVDFTRDSRLVVRDASKWAVSAHVTTLATTSDREIGIVAHVFDTTLLGLRDPQEGGARGDRGTNESDTRDPSSGAAPDLAVNDFHEPRITRRTSPLLNLIDTCFVDIASANGASRLPLFDDGRHGDGLAFDGVFGAFVPRWTSGDVTARVEIVGSADGVRFERAVQLFVPIVERRTLLTGLVETSVEDALRLKIELGALALTEPAQLHVSAEVWGIDERGEFAPVCWLSRMLVPEIVGGEWRLPMLLDGRWIDVTKTHAPFVLRKVRVQDPDTHAVYDAADWMPLDILTLPPIVGLGTSTVTRSMLSAPIPASSALLSPDTYQLAPKPFGRRLLLVHGYCSSGSIWPAADFTAPKQEFLDPNRNRSHDQFAQLLRTAVNARGSFGVVGHSQGGPAALHLYTYYVSGLDTAVGPRLIQSVASPYQGTPLASLGSFACGTNNDMTTSGAPVWLAGIPSWARARVHYWTTSNSGSACNFFTGLLLTDPEDGTTEQFRGQLPGANSMGHMTGWCHTTGMSNPANYTDHSRNALMNTNAAR